MRKWKRLLGLQLVLCLMLALLPVTASAALKISNVAIQIEAPVAGQLLDVYPTGGNDNQYNVGVEGQVLWYDVTEDRYSSATATAGHRYRVEISVYAKGVYDFDIYSTTATVNGERATLTGGTGRIYVEAYFDVPAPMIAITAANVYGVRDPIAGNTPDYAVLVGTDGNPFRIYDSTGSGQAVAWYDVTDGGELLTKSSVFETGHVYELRVALTANTGSYFPVYDGGAPAVTATLLGRPAVAMRWGEPGQSMMLSFTFPAAQTQKTASEVEIIELDTPKHGSKADFAAQIVGNGFSYGSGYGFAFKETDSVFSKNGITWYDDTADASMTINDTFIAGHTYTVTITLVPRYGHYFVDGVTGTLNGEAVTLTGGSQQLQITKTFALPVNKISTITVEGITAPATGKFPSYVAIVRGEGYKLEEKDDSYYKNGICWAYIDGGANLENYGYTFEPEQQFEIQINLVPEAGYQFDTQNLRATINGNAPHDMYTNANWVILVYRYPTPTAPIVISEVVIEDVVVPVAGAKPSYTATINDGRYELNIYRDSGRTKNGITWRMGSNDIGSSTVFEEGSSYSVVVAVITKDGYKFAKGGNIPGTINGMEAELIAYDENNVYYQLDFPAAKQPSVSAAAGAVSADTVTIVVTGNTGGQAADLYIAVYDADGRMIGIEKAEGQTPTGGSSEHAVTFDGLADLASVFLLNTDGVPYSGSASVDLR